MKKMKYAFAVSLLFGFVACDNFLFLFVSKEIRSFSFQGLTPAVVGTISGTDISATVPRGTDVKSLVATFTTTGSRVTVGDTIQISGTTANDFTNAVIYRVTAEDGSTNDYSVRVTFAALTIGSSYGGGKVFYLDGKGGGLVVTTSDLGGWVGWAGYGIALPGAAGTVIGTGKQNTEAIIAAIGDYNSPYSSSGSYAAKIAADYSITVDGVTYDDWFLPSKGELNEIYKNKVAVGGFSDSKYAPAYWSSSAVDYAYWSTSVADTLASRNTYAWCQWFGHGGRSLYNRVSTFKVRAIRAF